MNNISKNTVVKKGQLSVGALASRKRDELEQMKLAEQQRQLEIRAKREKLARELAELEVQERRSVRLHETNEMKTACYVLGELVLNAIRAGSISSFTLDNASLLQLNLEKQALIERVASRGKSTAQRPDIGTKKQEDDSTTAPDFPL